MYLADHWGLTQDGESPGAIITTVQQIANGESGSFQTDAAIRVLARTMLTEALNYDPGDTYEGVNGNPDKIVWSLIARTYLFDGNWSEAKSAAEKGLQDGDAGFQLIHTASYPNYMWYDAGRNNVLFSADPRFVDYVVADRKEGEIISNLEEESEDSQSLRGPEGDGLGDADAENVRDDLDNPNERIPLWELEGDANLAYCQDIYDARDDYLDLIDWREMELILAEVAIRNSDDAAGLTHINNVRTHHGLDELTVDDLTGFTPTETSGAGEIAGSLGLLIEERDKTLWPSYVRIIENLTIWYWNIRPGTTIKMP
jgi:hypothetical protein